MHKKLILPIATILVAAAAPMPNVRSHFAREMNAAMDRMMDAMRVRPTGDVDRDFTAMMIPHHQGAIDMAVAYLRYGHNDPLRRPPQETIGEQRPEIDAMRLAVGLPPSPVAAAPTQPAGDAAMQAT